MSDTKSIIYENDDLLIIDYSDKSYAAAGKGNWVNTNDKIMKDKVKNIFNNDDIKGKYNSNLTFKNKTIKGYVYSKKGNNEDELINILKSSIKKLKNNRNFSNFFDDIDNNGKCEDVNNEDENKDKIIKNLKLELEESENYIEELIDKYNRLKDKYKNLKQQLSDNQEKDI